MPTVRLIVSTPHQLAASVSQALFDAGAQGLEERPGRQTTLVTYAETQAALQGIWTRAARALAAQHGERRLPHPVFEEDLEETWKTRWTEHLRPIALTRRFVLSPTTADAPQLTPRQELLLYRPALAFGDGDHATTRLAAHAIEGHYRRWPGGALLDIGAGTGVLSFVAVRSGARRATGTDVDPEALRAARENAELNGLSKATRFVDSQARLSGSFDLAVVNIELRPLLGVLSALPTAARRVPRLLLTGFLKTQAPEVKRAALQAGFQTRRRAGESDWVLLEGTPAENP